MPSPHRTTPTPIAAAATVAAATVTATAAFAAAFVLLPPADRAAARTAIPEARPRTDAHYATRYRLDPHRPRPGGAAQDARAMAT
ncbi:hypothetical protein [Kitasatospora sp. NPDC094015]|uniref:hypothetical protein n=1 Tax=Kitasatospora sp. NPDC094015 TaxID=3155205 RepID=UPI00332EA8DC